MAEVTGVEEVSVPTGGLDPILQDQIAVENLGDPLLRQLYFGTADSPGFFNQLQNVGQNITQQLPAGLGMYLPFLQQAQALSALQAAPVTATNIGQFYDPFEDMVVQQTIDDVLKQAAIEDNLARAQAIGQAGEGAFGSRGRLQASERAEAIGRGLGKALPAIRSQGFSDALKNVFAQRGLFGQGADFSTSLAGLAPTLFEQDMFRPLRVLQGIGNFLPAYTPTTTQLTSQYGMAPDPTALGLGAGLGMFNLFRNKQPTSGEAKNADEKTQSTSPSTSNILGDVFSSAFGNRTNTGGGFGAFLPSGGFSNPFAGGNPSSSSNPFAGSSFSYSPFGGGQGGG
jgi:hypothetical protein